MNTGNGVCPETSVSIFNNGKPIQHSAYLDLGMGSKNGMLLGEAATKKIFKSKIPQTGKKGKAKMAGGMTAETTSYRFDSVSIFSQLYYDFPSTLTLSASGLLAGDRIWFGNDVLKSLGHIFINFETNELYIKKTRPSS